MIDWFVMLAPLAALPIVLLFVFVGCGLQTTGEPGAILSVSLNFSPSEMVDAPNVTNMVVQGKASIPSKGDIFHDTDWTFSHKKTLTGNDLVAGTATIDINRTIGFEDEAWVSCQCIITMSDGLSQTEPESEPLRHDKPEDSDQRIDFLLVRTGSHNFTLS